MNRNTNNEKTKKVIEMAETTRSKEDIQLENEELRELVRILQSDVDVLKETIIRQTMKMMGMMQ